MKYTLAAMAALAMMVGCAHKQVENTQLASKFEGWREIAADASPEKCVARLEAAKCSMSSADKRTIMSSIDTCKQVTSGSGKTTLQVLVTNRSDKVIVVETQGADRGSKAECPTTKYVVDRSGIAEVKSIANRLYMRSNDGQAYLMYADERFYEILNSKKKPYSTIADIRGAREGEDPNSVFLSFKNGGQDFEISPEKLQEKMKDGQLRKLDFVYSLSWSNIFSN